MSARKLMECCSPEAPCPEHKKALDKLYETVNAINVKRAEKGQPPLEVTVTAEPGWAH